jgi:succinoglycan biosynthesis transport protein ExoP
MRSIEGAQGAPSALPEVLLLVVSILRHWKLITAVGAFALTATYCALKIVPTSYKSTGQILVFDPQRQVTDSAQKPISSFIDATDDVAMNTEIEVIKSKLIALRVSRELNLHEDPEFQPSGGLGAMSIWTDWLGQLLPGPSEAIFQSAGDPDRAHDEKLDRAAGALIERLQVERVPLSYIISISATSRDPVKAQRIAAAIAEDYLASQQEARQEALERVASWLKDRTDDLRSRVLETEASIEKVKAETGITDTGLNNVADQQISEVNTQLITARGQAAEKSAYLDQARRVIETNGDVRSIPELAASPATSRLLQQQAELGSREAELRSKLGASHAYVISLREQLAAINKQVIAEADHVLGNLQSSYDIAVRREQSLEASLQKLMRIRGNSEVYLKLQQLRRVADADRKLYENYLSQFNEISQRGTLQSATARIITPATLPNTPSSPRHKILYAVAGIFGLGCGALAAFLIEYSRKGFKTAAQAEQSLRCSVLGAIPLLQHRTSRPIVPQRLVRRVVDTPLSQLSEAVTSIRIGLEVSAAGRRPKVILITSSVPGEGKSAAAMMLASSSASSGRRTVLLDCDLRQQSISGIFEKQRFGLSDLLRGFTKLDDVIFTDPKTGSYVISAGSITPNPADLLMSERMRNLIEELRREYDYVVMDTSPLLPVVDALGLAALADKIIIVVEWNRTPQMAVSEAIKMLRPEADRVAGIVLNKVDLKQTHGYGYGYWSDHNYGRPRRALTESVDARTDDLC